MIRPSILAVFVVALGATQAQAQYVVFTQAGVGYPALTSPAPVPLATPSGDPKDRGRATIPLGFTFPYYSNTYTSLTVTANGVAFLRPSTASYLTADFPTNTVIPSTVEPNGALAIFWDDLYGNNPTSVVQSQALVGPNGQGLAIEWKNWNRALYAFDLTFQMRLWQNGLVEYYYGPMSGTGTLSASVGIEAPTGATGTYGLTNCTTTCNLTHWDPTGLGVPITYMRFGPPTGIDLFGTQLAISGITETAGTLSITTRTTLRNFGTADANGFTYRLYLSADTLYDAADVELSPSPRGPFNVPTLGTVTDTATSTVTRPASGAWYVLAVVDDANSVIETNETNNTVTTAVPLAAGVDLLAQSITAPPAAGPNDPVVVPVRFSNIGFDAAGAVNVKIWASIDTVLDTSDRLLDTDTLTVGGGENVETDLSFNLPGTLTAGDYLLILQLDDGPAVGTVVETNDANNLAVSASKTTVQLADLIVDAMRVLSPQPPYDEISQAFFGEPARYEAVVRNGGGAIANNVTMAFYLSDNEVLNGVSDSFIGEVTGLTLGPGDVQTVTFTAPVPTTTPGLVPLVAGNYFFFAAAIVAGVPELNPGNNFLKASPTWVRGPAPNAVPVDVSGAARAGAGERMAVTRTLANFGLRDATQVTYRYYLSANTIVTTDDIPLTIIEGSGPVMEKSLDLTVDERDTAVDVVEIPPGVAATDYYLGVLVDPQDTIDETVESDNGLAGSRVQVSSIALAVATTALPDGVEGFPYAMQMSAVNGDGAYAYSVVNPDELPPGLTLDAAGLLSGTPTQSGAFGFTVRVASGGLTAQSRLTLRVVPFTATLQIATQILPAPARLKAYDTVLGAQGGVGPYTFSLAGGQLTFGLNLSTDGRLSGTPNEALGTTRGFIVRVRDSVGNSATRAFSLTVVDATPFQILSIALPSGVVGSEYVIDINAENASGAPVSVPVTWSLAEGTLPPGLGLEPSASDRVILSGTPTRAGLYQFSIQAVDNQGRSDSEVFTVLVSSTALKVLGKIPDELLRGDEVDVQLSTTPAREGLKWYLESGHLPPGLTFGEDGHLTGTVDAEAPLVAYPFTLKAGYSPTQILAVKGAAIEVVDVVTGRRTGCGCSGVETGVTALGALALLGLRRRRR